MTANEQLMQDIVDVFLARTKKITDFPPEHQKRMRDKYRFSGAAGMHEAAPVPKKN